MATPGQKAIAVGAVAGVSLFTSLGLLYMMSRNGVITQTGGGGGTGTGTRPPVATFATYPIQIIDNVTKDPIRGVVCTAGSYKKTTDSNGMVEFQFPVGHFIFSASHPDYVWASASGGLWFNVTKEELGQTFQPQVVEMVPNVMTIESVAGYLPLGELSDEQMGCKLCQIKTNCLITLVLKDTKGMPLSGKSVTITRVFGSHKVSGSTTATKATDSNGRVQFTVKPSGQGRCGYGAAGWNAWYCERGTSEWRAVLNENQDVSTTVVAQYAAPSFGDEFWDALC